VEVVVLDTPDGDILARGSYYGGPDYEFVVAAGMNGTLWVLAAADLTILRKIRLDYGNFQPSSLLIADGMLLVSTHNGAGENGAILVLKDWVPRLGHP